MIIGSGLMARVFAGRPTAGADVVVLAAGVSNSQCSDPREFERERELVERTLGEAVNARQVVYFSTCSVHDEAAAATHYVRHKLAMEDLVRQHPGHLILRLPQVAGRTPNPHTLLNYLYARISRGERFAVWRHAQRNVIDCDDVRAIGFAVLESGQRGATMNIAAPRSYPMTEIVGTMERVVGGHAIFDLLDRGGAFPIDLEETRALWDRGGLAFATDYLEHVIRKYYGPGG
jgi:dTDP-4-dehydrorhamnose reductase